MQKYKLKVELQDPPTTQVIEYPILMRSNSGLVLLMTNANCGTVLREDDDHRFKFAGRSHTWKTEHFVPFEDTIVFQNTMAPYPCLKIDNNNNIIVLFEKLESGTVVVCKQMNSEYKVADYRANFNSAYFKPYNNRITFSNEPVK